MNKNIKTISFHSVKTALWAGFVGGNLSSFVKWGSEIPFPPRTPDRISPPFQMLQDMGLSPDLFTYVYSGHVINAAVALSHQMFSLVFGIFYCLVYLFFPAIAAARGVYFGIAITILFHGLLLPVFHWAPPMWDLSWAELFSETLGHVLWAWCIEICREYVEKNNTKIKI